MTFHTIAEARAYGKAHPEDWWKFRNLADLYAQKSTQIYYDIPIEQVSFALAAAEAAEQAKLSTNTTREKP